MLLTKFYLKKVNRDWLRVQDRPVKPYSVFDTEKEMNAFLERNGMVKAPANTMNDEEFNRLLELQQRVINQNK